MKNDWEDEPWEMFDKLFEDFLNSNFFTVQGYNMDKYVMEHIDVSQCAPKLNIQSQFSVLKFIDNCVRSLKSKSPIAPEDFEKAQRTMGWFPKYFIKCTFDDTTKLAKQVVYKDPSGHHMKSR